MDNTEETTPLHTATDTGILPHSMTTGSSIAAQQTTYCFYSVCDWRGVDMFDNYTFPIIDIKIYLYVFQGNIGCGITFAYHRSTGSFQIYNLVRAQMV